MKMMHCVDKIVKDNRENMFCFEESKITDKNIVHSLGF